jgi:hypothetical protein
LAGPSESRGRPAKQLDDWPALRMNAATQKNMRAFWRRSDRSAPELAVGHERKA